MKERISKSLILDWRLYQEDKECGLKLKAKHIDKNYVDKDGNEDTGDAALLGQYAEYIFFGSVPESLAKKGRVPQAQYGKDKPKTEANMLAAYKEVHRKKPIIDQLLKDMKITVEKKNYRADGVDKDNCWGTAIIDLKLVGHYFGTNEDGSPKRVTADLKYSGLIDDVWKPYGFAFERKEQFEQHGVQVMQYKWVDRDDFWLFLVSSKTGEDLIEFVKCEPTEEAMQRHRDEAITIKEKLNLEEQIGFRPVPSLARCNECLIKESCKFKAKYPTPRVVKFL